MKVTGGQSPCALHDGDKIRLGDLLIEVYFK
jgi:hypothetical protein